MPSNTEAKGALSLLVLSNTNHIIGSTSTTAADRLQKKIERRYSPGLGESGHWKVPLRTVLALVCAFAGKSSAITAERYGTKPGRTGRISCSPYPGDRRVSRRMLSENMLSAGFDLTNGWRADSPDAHFNCAVLRTLLCAYSQCLLHGFSIFRSFCVVHHSALQVHHIGKLC